MADPGTTMDLKPEVSQWRALVDKELAGAAFDKLVQKTPEGLALEPLYVERPAEAAADAAWARDAAEQWKLCVRIEAGAGPGAEPGAGIDAVVAELDGGADAIWCAANARAVIDAARGRGVAVVLDDDPAVVSMIGFHDQGADAADELALGLSSLVALLRRHAEAGEDLAAVAATLTARVAVGRDTFGEVCKLRALRVCWHKVLVAAGVPEGRLATIHAVGSSRTLSQRDPWVNMLRVTTQVFAAALGGAQLITPRSFDAAYAEQSALGHRVARNTALVLREESALGRVRDAAGGSYYFETRTHALAREAWARFQAIEREGGVEELARSGKLAARLEAAWKARAASLAKRKEPLLGVSEFPNLREDLAPLGAPGAVGGHRDSEAFEALRARVDGAPRAVSLVLLGPAAEHRGRVGFAEALFAVAGLVAKPLGGEEVDIACICGSDERYALEAADSARALKAAGAKRVVLAGRPGALESELREAGVDAFIFVGCDVLETFEGLLA